MMKKLLSSICVLAFTALITVLLTTGACAEKKTAAGVKLQADTAFTAAVTSAQPQRIADAESLVAGSKKSAVKPQEAAELARLTFLYADNTIAERVFYKKDAAVYILDGKKLREVPAADFYAFAHAIGTEFYTLRPIPQATANGAALRIAQSSYSFEKLDGIFYKTRFTQAAAPVFKLEDKKLPVPAFSQKPKTVRAAVTLDGGEESLWNGTLADIGSFTLPHGGTYSIKFAATYDMAHARGEVVYEYRVTYSDEIALWVDGADTNPGEVVVLRAKNIPENAVITVKSDIEFKPNFFKQPNGEYIALLPVSYYTAPGAHYVELTCGEVVKKFGITANNKKFAVQNLTVAAETTQETINSQKANNEYENAIAPLRTVADNKQYWQGRFIWPVKGERRVTTQFATIRYVNGGKTASRHGAIDFACPTGTPVYASGAGRVLYAGFLQLTGNTVLIEHGYGLKTWHYHMNSLNVKTGDMVTQGQKIGEVGTTGFSTGAHLHFGMSVNNVFVNPETAITTDLFA